MILNIVAGVCVVIGLILIGPDLLAAFARFRKKKTVPVVDAEQTVEEMTKEIKETDKTNLAVIVSEWENFVNLLVANNMQESAEDMKTLLTKMVQEYRSELNEDDEELAVGSIKGIAVSPATEE